MIVALFCQFAPETANGILMADRTATERAAGREARLYTLTFKDGSGRKRPWSLLRVLGVAWSMRRADAVIVQEPLPLGIALCLALRALRAVRLFGGYVRMVHADWHGVGGFANTRSAGNKWAKVLLTWCEESAGDYADRLECLSKTLYQRAMLNPRWRGKVYRSYNGATG